MSSSNADVVPFRLRRNTMGYRARLVSGAAKGAQYRAPEFPRAVFTLEAVLARERSSKKSAPSFRDFEQGACRENRIRGE